MSAHPSAIQGSPEAPSVPAALLDYLCVDNFIRDFVDAGALRSAFQLRLIDLLVARGERPFAELVTATGSDPQGLAFLIDLLYGNRVVDTRGGLVSLHPAFVKALRYRELIEVKLEYAGFMAGDYNNLFTAMVANPQRFMRHARLFKLFDYGRCLEITPENLRHTRTWMRLTSALTRHEAPVCLTLHDLSAHRRMLDVGGNSGEFVLQACRRHPALAGAVLDLPVVCQVGMEHVLGEPEAERIGFHAGDLRRDELPGGHDLITFKSMLHDWPVDDAIAFIGKAAAAVQPGGTVLIFERGPLDVRSATPLFASLPVLMFFRSYRSPGAYVKAMQSFGLTDVRCVHLQLDTPFFVVTARKPAR